MIPHLCDRILIMKKTLAFLTPIIIVLFIVFFLIQKQQSQSPTATARPSPSPKTALNSAFYEQKDLGFSVELPEGFKAQNNGKYSRLIIKSSKEGTAGSAGFVYISVIPKGAGGEAGEIYNYSQIDVQTLRALQIGEQAVLGVNASSDQAKYFTFKRIEGAMLGGYGAKGFLNTNPWEFPPGTLEYRYLVEFEEALFLIGYYVQENTSADSLTKSDADRILSALKINPASIVNDFSKPVEEGEWKKFSSTDYKISFSYPSGWEIAENSQNFENGDIFALRVLGQTQRTQTELYDGASFAVMKPQSTNENLSQWVRSAYADTEMSPDRPAQFDSVSFAGITYEKVYVCGLGCFTYYHTKQNNLIYGFVFIAEGQHSSEYESVISRIMSSVKFIQ